MSSPYPQLTYVGDVTGCEQAQPGHLLGCDEVARFYEVIDAEYIGPPVYEGCLDHDFGPHTHVNLQYATPENLKRAARKSEN